MKVNHLTEKNLRRIAAQMGECLLLYTVHHGAGVGDLQFTVVVHVGASSCAMSLRAASVGAV